MSFGVPLLEDGHLLPITRRKPETDGNRLVALKPIGIAEFHLRLPIEVGLPANWPSSIAQIAFHDPAAVVVAGAIDQVAVEFIMRE